MLRRTLLVISALGACSSPSGVVPATPAAPQAEEPRPPTPPSVEWSDVTRSPWVFEPGEREREMTAACGAPDGALTRVAVELASERAHRVVGPPAAAHALALLRARGEPHVRPRIVSVMGHRPSDDARVRSELMAKKGARDRCGVAFEPLFPDREVMVAVIVEALADLDPVARRGRTGEWLTFAARVHVPVSSPKLVVLGSRGLPRTVPTSIDRTTGRVGARFSLDRPGRFNVQLVGDLGEGPRPLLEAEVFADVALPRDLAPEPVPGDMIAIHDEPDEEHIDWTKDLAPMIEAMRREESLPPFRRDARLDALARAHAEEMKASRAVAHDLGDGDLSVRFEGAGLAAKVVGENVARAGSVNEAHRVLWASPSHRMNLLRADYTHVGFAVVKDGDDFYVCEVFAGGLR